ncbi:CTP synthase [Atractiella rhizophila]|nr:CTP synthase [Atractiella rhizophila]
MMSTSSFFQASIMRSLPVQLPFSKIINQVIENERKGDVYLGSTVQVIPHVTDAIQEWIENAARISVDDSGEEADVCIIELGGTVGDIESMQFVEALRQFQFKVGSDNFALIHVSLVPDIHGEKKTKPTQASVKDLRGLGLTPDLIACRCSSPLNQAIKQKISNFTHVGPDQVLAVHDVASIYHVPLLLREQGLLVRLYGVQAEIEGQELMRRWKEMTEMSAGFLHSQERLHDKVHIVLVGKYTSLKDSYTSVVKALEHASFRCRRKLVLTWVDSSSLEPQAEKESPKEYHEAWHALCSASGIIIPGGFGVRGTGGMILAARWAREKKVPFLGICLGFQVAVIEWARNVLGHFDANSTELDPQTEHQTIIYMPEISRTHLGGTQRLGLRPTIFQSRHKSQSIMRRLYGGRDKVWERHRHRYEVNPLMVDELENSGISFVGRDDRGERMQIFEVFDHPYYVGLQSHPELCTRPLNPSPPYLGFVAAAAGNDVLKEQMEGFIYKQPHPSRHERVPTPFVAEGE